MTIVAVSPEGVPELRLGVPQIGETTIRVPFRLMGTAQFEMPPMPEIDGIIRDQRGQAISILGCGGMTIEHGYEGEIGLLAFWGSGITALRFHIQAFETDRIAANGLRDLGEQPQRLEGPWTADLRVPEA